MSGQPTYPGPEKRSRRSGERSCILFALSGPVTTTEPLIQASDWAGALGADLHLVHVVSEGLAAAAQSAGTLLHILRTSGHRPDEFVDRQALAARVRVRVGDFIEAVAARAGELGAELIVVPPSAGGFGRTVMTLSQTARLPVLVCRQLGSQRMIVTGAKLSDDDSEALRKASEMRARLHAKVVAVHNVSSSLAPQSIDGERPRELTEKFELGWTSSAASSAPPMMVAHERDAVDAILLEARARDATLVVVGGSHRSHDDRLNHPSIAGRIVNRATRSVLVTPVGASGRGPSTVPNL